MSINNDPVGLPPGSFDYDTLKSGLGKASRGAKSTYDKNVDTALKDASASLHTGGHLGEAGFEVIERQHEQLGVTEKIQVYIGDKPAEIVTGDNAVDVDNSDDATVDHTANPGSDLSVAEKE